MTDQAQGLAPAVGEEPAGLPTPQISPASPAEHSATTSPDADAIVERLLERLKTELDPVVEAKVLARVNSMKDKRLAKVDEILEYVKQAGGDASKVQGPLTIRTLEERLEALEKPASAATPGRVAKEDDDAKAAEILSKIKRDSEVVFTPEEVSIFWGKDKSFTSWENAEEAARKAAAKKLKGENITTGATVSTGGRSAPVQSETDDEIAAKLEEAFKKPTANAGELKRLKEEAKKRGLLK